MSTPRPNAAVIQARKAAESEEISSSVTSEVVAAAPLPPPVITPAPAKAGETVGATLLPPEKAALDHETMGEMQKTKAALDAEPKIQCVVPMNPAIPNEYDVTVWINGYAFQIMRNQLVAIPIPVYQLLVQAGELMPMRQEEIGMMPKVDPTVERRYRFANPQ